MKLAKRNARLYWSALALSVYVLVLMAVEILNAQSKLERASYVAAIATLPGRFHEPMSHYEIQRLAQILRELESGENLRSLGLKSAHPPLAEILGADHFDMSSTLALLKAKRLGPARAKVALLASKVQRSHTRRARFYEFRPWLAVIGMMALIAYVSFCWWAARGRLSDDISFVAEGDDVGEGVLEVLPNQPDTFIEYLDSVIKDEVAFTGFHARLKSDGFNEQAIPASLTHVLETVTEQLVRNSIEHGGRAPDLRILANKAEYIQIEVSFAKVDAGFKLVVRDDGEGIDEKLVLQRALSLGLISSETVASAPPGQGIKYIFLPGYSEYQPAFGVAENSIGLDKVRQLAREHKGSISVRNMPGQYCQFSFVFKEP